MKKIVSLILTLSIILSCVSVFASDIVLDYDKYQDDLFRFDVGDFVDGGASSDGYDPDKARIEMLAVLGIWDDASIVTTALVTRTEFSVIMSKLRLGTNNPLINVYTHENNVTDEIATYKDAYAYLIEALGYSHKIAEYGGDEKALLIAAKEIGLTVNENTKLDGFVTRNNLAKLMEEAIKIDICVKEFNDYGGYTYEVSEGKTILNTIHGIYDVSGFVNAVYGLSVYGGVSLREGEIEINRKVVKTGEFNCNGYFGIDVDAFTRYDADLKTHTLIYISADTESESIEIDFADITDLKGNTLEYIDSTGAENYIVTDNFTNIVENGRKINSLSQMSSFKTNEGKIILTSSNSYGDLDTIIIYKYDYFVVKYVDLLQSCIGFEYGMKYNDSSFITIDEKKVNRIILDGEEIPYSKIPINSSIRIMECAHTGYLEIICSTDKVVGSIDGMDENVIISGGRHYKVSSNMLKRIEECENDDTILYNDKLRMPSMGANVTLYVFDNIVVGYTQSDKYLYGYLRDVKLSRSQIDPDVTLRVYTQEAEWLDLTLKDKLTLDGVEGVSKDDVRDFIISNSSSVVGELIRFSKNKEDQVTFFDTIVESTAERDTTDDLVFADGHENGVHNWTCDWTRTDIKNAVYKFEAGIPVFAIPLEEEKEDKYRIVTLNSFTEREEYEIVMYSPDEFLHLPVILYRGDMSVSVDEGTYSHLYIQKLSQCIIDEDGNLGYKLTGIQFVDGRTRGVGNCVPASFYVTEEQYKTGNLVVGDLIRIYATKDKIDKFMFEDGFARGTGAFTLPEGVYTLDYNAVSGVYNYLYVGTIKKIDLERLLVLVDCGDGGTHVKVPRAKGFVDTDKNKVTDIKLSDFHEGDFVVIFNIGETIHTRFMIKYADNQ